MITSGFGEHKKLYIESYEDSAFSIKAEKVEGVYSVLINPESYMTKEKVEFCDTQAPGRSMPILKFNKMPASEMNFDFLFDSTGVVSDSAAINFGIPNPLAKSEKVAVQIEDFKKRVFHYEGEIHKPYYLKICWGTLIFKCVLTSIDIEYKLFNTDGAPLRAIAKCVFKGTIDETLLLRIEKKSSPDVTHERILKSGDKLSLMTKKIYNNQKYLLPVAAFNVLDGFRNIKAGRKIFFPPVEK